MPIAYSYIRFSTLEQKKGDSLRRQQELSAAYAQEYGLTLDRTLNLYDLGVSAYSGRNREEGRLGAFLNAVETGHIVPGSYLLVESLDRLSREEVLASLPVFLSILNSGITVVTLADRAVYSRETVGANPLNLMMSLVVMTRAHEESAMKSRRVKAAWDAKRKNVGTKKLTSRCPLWMRLNPAKTEFELIPDRVEIVRTMVRMANEGMGQAQIAKRLNEQRVPGFSGEESNWQPSYVNKILTGPALFGQMQPKVWENGRVTPTGDPIDGYYPAVISEGEFYLLQAARGKRRFGGAKARKGRDMPNLFSGLVKCGYCSSSMVLATAPGPRKMNSVNDESNRPATKYLVCDGARRGKGCHAVQWNYKDFETSFLAYFSGVDFSGFLEQISGSDAHNAERKALDEQLQLWKAELAAKSAAKDNLLKVILAGSALSPDFLAQEMHGLQSVYDEIETRVRRLEEEARSLDKQTRPVDEQLFLFWEYEAKLETLTDDERFRLRVAMSEQIRELVAKIDIHPAGRLRSLEEVERMRLGLVQAGYAEGEIGAYIEQNLRTEPKRQGRGSKGRYQSAAEVGRFFVIRTHSNHMRVISPRFDDPSRLVVDFGWADLGTETQV